MTLPAPIPRGIGAGAYMITGKSGKTLVKDESQCQIWN